MRKFEFYILYRFFKTKISIFDQQKYFFFEKIRVLKLFRCKIQNSHFPWRIILNSVPSFQVLMNTKKYNRVSAIEYMYTSFPLQDGTMVEVETDRYGGANFYTTAFGWNKLYPQKNGDFEYKKWGKRHWMRTWFGLTLYHSQSS